MCLNAVHLISRVYKIMHSAEYLKYQSDHTFQLPHLQGYSKAYYTILSVTKDI